MNNTDAYKTRWLKRHLLIYAIIYLVLSLIVFVLLDMVSLILRNEVNYIAYLVGLCAGIFLGYFSYPNLVLSDNPRRAKIMSVTEIDAFLRPIWKKIPRIYFWLANLPYIFVPLLSWVLSKEQPPKLPLETFVVGFVPSYSLCAFISSLYLLWHFVRSRNNWWGMR